MLTDLRLAFRSLSKTPGFSLVVVLTLALGIGANTAIFSFFRGILLRPLPVGEAGRVVLVKKDARDFRDPLGAEAGILAADFRELQGEVRLLEDLATYTLDSATLTGLESPDLVVAAVVSGNFFSVLRSPAAVGHAFSGADAADGARLATLSHRAWHTRFGGDPAVIGRSVRLNNVAVTIVGVMPADFEFPREVEFWVSPAADVPENQIGLPPSDFNGRGHHLRTIIGRLRPGVGLAQAEEEFAARFAERPNPNQANRTVHLMTMRDHLVGEVRPVLALLLGCVGLVLLIACLNVANLMLSRALGRRHEIAIRAALGASRGRIARQLLAESMGYAIVGGLAGVLLSTWGLALLLELAPATIPRLDAVRLDATVLIFACGLTLLTGLACGLSPVLTAGRHDLVNATKAAGRGSSAGPASRRIRSTLVAGEVAIAVVLLVAAGLLLRSLAQMQAFAWGIDPARVVTARVAFVGERYGEAGPQRQFYRALLDRLERTPGFDSVGTRFDPIGESWVQVPFTPEGHTYAHEADRPLATFHQISPGYFRTLGIPILQGRAFTESDDADAPLVAIVDETLARRFFPAGDAVGRRIELPGATGNIQLEIVGIAAPVRAEGPLGIKRPEYYRPFLQTPWNNFYVHVRTTHDLATVGRLIRQAVEAIDPAVPVSDLATLTQLTSKPAAARQFPLGLLGAFAATALVLAAVGIYAVSAYAVVQRTREIGVRMALGASPRAVVRLVIREGLRPVALGLVAGLAGAILTAFAMRNLLFDIAPLDLPTFLAVLAGLIAVALLACLLPARRATRVDPLTALRAE